jgi:hypothetical protein
MRRSPYKLAIIYCEHHPVFCQIHLGFFLLVRDGLIGPGVLWSSLALTEPALLAQSQMVGAAGALLWGPDFA